MFSPGPLKCFIVLAMKESIFEGFESALVCLLIIYPCTGTEKTEPKRNRNGTETEPKRLGTTCTGRPGRVRQAPMRVAAREGELARMRGTLEGAALEGAAP